MSGGGWFDSEAIEAERFDADLDMAELEAAGRESARARRTSLALRAAGDLEGAARACRHGGGYPLNSIAARNANDPRAGQSGFRCLDCGSVVSETCHRAVIHPCELGPS